MRIPPTLYSPLSILVLLTFPPLIFNNFNKPNVSVNKVAAINEGKVAIFGASATLSPTKYFNYTASTSGSQSGEAIINVGTSCSLETSWDKDKVKELSEYYCTATKGGQACSKSGVMDASSTKQICLVVYCIEKVLGGSNCAIQVNADLTDKLGITVSTQAIPYLYPTVRVDGTGFGSNISSYKSNCVAGNGKPLDCKVKTIVDSESLDLNVSSLLSFFNSGPVSLELEYLDQKSGVVQIGVAQFGSIFNYTKWLILLLIILGIIGYFVYARMKKKKEEQELKNRNNNNDTTILKVNSANIPINRRTEPVRLQVASPADDSNAPATFY